MRLKKEPKEIVEETKVPEPVLEKVLPKGIIPADYIPEDKDGVTSNENKDSTNIPKRPVQLNREFLIHQGSEFLKGEIKVQENDTKIARINDTEYIIYKNI